MVVGSIWCRFGDFTDLRHDTAMHDGVHGRIVPIGKPDRLLAAIEAAFAQRSETAAMAERARERVEGVLSFESRVRRVEAIYEEVAGHA